MTSEPYVNWREVARQDPAEAHEIWTARYELAVEQYNSEQITHTVFSASLYALGFRGQDLSAELRHRESLKLSLTGRC